MPRPGIVSARAQYFESSQAQNGLQKHLRRGENEGEQISLTQENFLLAAEEPISAGKVAPAA